MKAYVKSLFPTIPAVLISLAAILLGLSSCKHGSGTAQAAAAYVSAPQVNLRDRLSAMYNKVGVVKNGERVEVLEKKPRFARVRSVRGEEGWLEQRYLAPPEVYDAFAKLARENAGAPVQARGLTRAELKLHVTPGRETESLYRWDEGAKVDILKRGTAEKPQAPVNTAIAEPRKSDNSGKGNKASKAEKQEQSPPLEDWWLARDAQGHTGWVLARMIDIDVPVDIAQYAEGQRIMAALVLNEVPDTENGQARQVPQYLTVTTEPHDGAPYDFDQIRVFTWNEKRHRYETAYREHRVNGVFPVTVGHQVFDKEGDLPTFTIRVKEENGNIAEHLYKLNQPIVRRVYAPGEHAEPRKSGGLGTRSRRAKKKKT